MFRSVLILQHRQKGITVGKEIIQFVRRQFSLTENGKGENLTGQHLRFSAVTFVQCDDFPDKISGGVQ